MTLTSPYLAFKQTALQYPGNDFLHIPASARKHYATPEPLTLKYGETLTRIDEQVERYLDAGYRAGIRVALLLENRPEFFVHFFALNALGISVVPLNADSRPHEIAYVAEHSEIVLAVGIYTTKPLLHAALQDKVPVADVNTSALPMIESTGRSVTTPSIDDECALLYMSGTTGKPKGCILDNRYFLSIGEIYITEDGLCEVRPGVERLITPLPLFHINALACSTMAMVLSAGCVIQLDRFHPRSWWADVGTSGATIVHYLGVMPAILLGMEADAPVTHSVRFGYGTNVDPKHQQVFEQRFSFPLIEGWAMTETGGPW